MRRVRERDRRDNEKCEGREDTRDVSDFLHAKVTAALRAGLKAGTKAYKLLRTSFYSIILGGHGGSAARALRPLKWNRHCLVADFTDE